MRLLQNVIDSDNKHCMLIICPWCRKQIAVLV